MNAIAAHIWLLVTFRHDLRGLRPARFQTLVAVVVLSCLVCWARWDPFTALVHGFVLWLFASASPRLAVAVALVSVGIDLIAIPIELADGLLWIGLVMLLWELSAICFYSYRNGRLRDA